jgi:hypothetical protein
LNIPALIQSLYGVFAWTGLYSFEFMDKNGTTITEVFLMIPPKSKSVTESTRSTTVPTLSGNYNNDAGNSTKNITLSGDLYVPYVGSPDNPVARDNSGLKNTIDGLNEFFKLRWMLVRYRDYTMTKKAVMTVPSTVMNLSPQISALYSAIEKKLNSEKVGALYDEIRVIFHDYDMDDHWFCRVGKFSSSQSAEKHIAISYTIELECYEPAIGRGIMSVTQVKKPTNELTNMVSNQLQSVNFSEQFSDIQADIGYNAAFVSTSVNIEEMISSVKDENELIQAGQSTASTLLPILTYSLLLSTNQALQEFINTFLSDEQKILYLSGDLTIDDILDINLLIFYNTLQKVRLYTLELQGVINSIIKQEEIRFYANSNNYTLTEDQFDNIDKNSIENNTGFYYYTVIDGDTSRIIALRELQDSGKFINILQINNITENGFIDGTLIGKQIKIPMLGGTTRADNNLVYESNADDIQAFLYGSDIATGINREIVSSGTGDIKNLEGLDNVVENVENRLNALKGSLNVFSPNWGTIAIDDSNAPMLVKINRYLTDVINQIQSDPRIESVKMDLKQLKFAGESISVPTKVFFIGSEETREVLI